MLPTIQINVRKAAASVAALDEQSSRWSTNSARADCGTPTLVVFTAACGALWGRHGLWDSGDASDPPNMFEESVATPIIWSWPGHIPAIAQRPDLVSAYDFVPTMCDLSDRIRRATSAAAVMGRW